MNDRILLNSRGEGPSEMQTFPSPRAFFLLLWVWFYPDGRIGTMCLCQVSSPGARSVYTEEGKDGEPYDFQVANNHGHPSKQTSLG